MKSVMDLINVNAPTMLAPLRQPKPELSEALKKEYARLLDKYERSPVDLAS
jgi:4-hydroxy-tetrahydrodipicolinate synthase